MKQIRHLLQILLIAGGIYASSAQAEYYPTLVPVYGPPIQLLSDTTFTAGFRAYWSCDWDYSLTQGERDLHLGQCRAYGPNGSGQPYVTTQYGKPYAYHSWPDLGAPDDSNKAWDINEGVHKGPMSVGNYYIPAGIDLDAYRLDTNAFSYVDGNSLMLWSYNNFDSNDPNHDQLVHVAQTNPPGTPLGTIKTYANTQTEIRNVATEFSSQFANDTWPHFLVEQNFKQLIDLATLDTVNFSVDLQVFPVNLIGPAPGGTSSDAIYSINFVLRRKEDHEVLFIGYYPYGAHSNLPAPPEYNEGFGPEQNGQATWHGNVADVGGPWAPDGSNRTFSVELRSMLTKAVAAIGGRQYTLDEYYLAAVGMGWEAMGYAAFQSQISNVSLIGYPKMEFDSEIYQDDSYASNNGDLAPAGVDSPALRRAHWTKYGVDEGRSASPTFSAAVYLQKYPDIAAAYGATNYRGAISHYIQYGRGEGRTGHW